MICQKPKRFMNKTGAKQQLCTPRLSRSPEHFFKQISLSLTAQPRLEIYHCKWSYWRLNIGWNFFLFFNFDALPAIQVQEISPNIAFDNRIRARSNESILLELERYIPGSRNCSQLHLFSGTALPSAICKIKILDTFKTAVNTHFVNLAFKWIFFYSCLDLLTRFLSRYN